MARQALKDKFIAVLSELGGSAGNGRLRDALEWTDATYGAVKDELVAEGAVVPGRGRGGSVSVAGGNGVKAARHAPAAPIRAKPPRGNANGNGGDLGFEAELFKAADKLRGNMEPSDYKHVALGLIFLKHISDSFEAKRMELLADYPDGGEDRDEYAAENVFWVPPTARWSHLQANAKQPSIGKLIDEAMIAIEKDNENLKGVLPKDYARPALNAVTLGELIDLISGIALGRDKGHARDVLGRVYEYFLGQVAGSEGKRGGEFYTPRSVVRVMVEMIEPFKGRVYDPCCGSGGMFVQSERFVEEHGGRMGDIAVYGQESNYTTWRLCKMNLAVRGIDADIKWNSEGSFHKDELRDLKADFVLANPPFNISDWGGDRLREDVRWKYGAPPASNANFAWVQHIAHHLAPAGVAGVVLANGSMSSTQNGENEIRRALIEGVNGAPGVIDCMVALPGQLFYSTQIPVCLWFLARDRSNGLVRSDKLRDRREEILFIDARKLGHMVDRTRKELSDLDIAKITQAYHAWRGEGEAGVYADVAGFCKSASLEEIKEHDFVLTPGRYVGATAPDEDDLSFETRFAALRATLQEQFGEADWSPIRLGDLVDIKHGFAFRGEYFSSEGPGDILLTPGNFSVGGGFQWGKPKYYVGPVPAEFILHQGDLVVTMTDLSKEADTLGYGAIVPRAEQRLLHNQRIGKVIRRSELACLPFLHWVMRSPAYRHHVLATLSGSTVKHTSPARLLGFRFELPSPLEQQGIASVLCCLDEKIELNRRTNETLETTGQVIFRDWFVDFGPTRAKTERRAPYLASDPWSLFPSHFDEEGKPQGWTSESVYDQAVWMNGAAYKDMYFSSDPDALPVVKIAELKNGISKSTRFTSTNLGDRYKIHDRELLFSWSGNPDTSIDTFIWTSGDAWLNQHIFAVRANGKRTPTFLYAMLKQLRSEFAEIARNKQTTGLGHVTQQDLIRLKITVPNERIQSAFEEIVGPVHARFTSNLFENQTLAATRDFLLPKLMSGEVRVKEAEKVVGEVT